MIFHEYSKTGMALKIGELKYSQKKVDLKVILSSKENPTNETNVIGTTTRSTSHGRWKSVDDMSDLLKDRMVDEAKKSAYARYYLRFGFQDGNDFYVDELRRFVKYHGRSECLLKYWFFQNPNW